MLLLCSELWLVFVVCVQGFWHCFFFFFKLQVYHIADIIWLVCHWFCPFRVGLHLQWLSKGYVRTASQFWLYISIYFFLSFICPYVTHIRFLKCHCFIFIIFMQCEQYNSNCNYFLYPNWASIVCGCKSDKSSKGQHALPSTWEAGHWQMSVNLQSCFE